jgi:hypothetical protein
MAGRPAQPQRFTLGHGLQWRGRAAARPLEHGFPRGLRGSEQPPRNTRSGRRLERVGASKASYLTGRSFRGRQALGCALRVKADYRFEATHGRASRQWGDASMDHAGPVGGRSSHDIKLSSP